MEEPASLDGAVTRWREDGGREIATFRAGVLEGKLTVLDAQGRLRQEMVFTGGVLDGAMVEYGPEGAEVSLLTWRAGRLEGLTRFRDAAGRMTEMILRDGRAVEEIRVRDAAGEQVIALDAEGRPVVVVPEGAVPPPPPWWRVLVHKLVNF